MKLITISRPTHVFLDSTIAERLLNQLKIELSKSIDMAFGVSRLFFGGFL